MGGQKVLAQPEVGGFSNKGLCCAISHAVFAGGNLRGLGNEGGGMMKKLFIVLCLHFLALISCFAEDTSMELIFKRGKEEVVFYQGAPLVAVQRKIESAVQTDGYVKSAVDNIAFVVLVKDSEGQRVYKVYNQYNIIKNDNEIYESDLFYDLCIILINSLFAE